MFIAKLPRKNQPTLYTLYRPRHTIYKSINEHIRINVKLFGT